MKTGDIITKEDFCFKRRGIGFLPIEQDQVIGHRLLVDIEADRVIRKEFID